MADTPTDPATNDPAQAAVAPDAPAQTAAAELAPTPPTEPPAATSPEAPAAPSEAAPVEAAAVEEKPVEIPAALQACVAKIHETIQNDLDDRELVKVLKKHVRKLKEWDQWSEHARNAYAHLIAAEIIHSKAASICIDNGIEFENKGRSEYEHLLRAVQKRTPRQV